MQVVEGLRTHSNSVSLAKDKSGNNESVVSCGQNEALGLWKYEDGELVVEDIELSGSTQSAIAFHNNKIFFVMNKHQESDNVLTYFDMNLRKMKFLTSFGMEITALDVDPDGKVLIVGTIDFNIKCYVLDGGLDLWRSSELDGQICSIQVSLDSKYYAASTSNGKIFVFDATEGSSAASLKECTVCDRFSIGRDTSPKLCMAWFGNVLFLPSKGCVKTLKSGTWNDGLSYECDLECVFSVVSVNEDVVAACTTSGHVVCWTRLNRRVCLNETIEQVSKDRHVTSMIINPDDNLLIGNNGGSVFNINWPKQKAGISFEDDDEGDLGKIKSQYALSSHVEPDIPVHLVENKKQKNKKLPKMLHSGQFNPQDGMKCLVWNRFGKIVAIESEDDNCIEISFNDASISEDFVEDNIGSNFELGDMNGSLIGLASKKNDQKESVLYVRNVGAWHRESRVWSKKMPEKEVIQAVVVGQDFVVAYTDMRFVRIYTANGLQRLVVSFPNNVHSFIAGNKQLAVVTVSGFLEDGDREEYQYNVEVMNVNVYKSNVIGRRTITPIALSCESELRWMSFTDKGHLVTMDDLFMVRILNECQLWIPVFNGADELKNSDDSIWPIYVTEAPINQFRYLYLRHRKLPSLKKTEITTISSLNIPVMKSTNEKESQLESELLLNDFFTNTSVNSDADRAKLAKEHSTLMIKLFSEVLKENQEGKALEIGCLTNQLHAIQILCNFAAKQNRPVLSDKISEVGKTLSMQPHKENKTPSINSPSNYTRRVELKRRVSILPDLSKTQDPTDASNGSSEISANTFVESSAPLPLNPFKRHSNTFSDSPTEKKKKDIFGSLLN